MISKILITFLLMASYAQEPSVPWLTGPSFERTARKNAVSADWVQAPLGTQLRSFSSAQQIAVFLDRRIDPTQLVDLRSADLTLEQFLWSVADKFDLGVCEVENVFYLGPKEVTAVLPVLIDELIVQANNCEASAIQKRSMLGSYEFNETGPFEPMVAFRQIADLHQVKILDDSKLSMDLWSGTSLPEMPALVCMSLIVVGFDCWLDVSANGDLSVIEFPKVANLARSFKGDGNLKTLTEQLKKDLPQLSVITKHGAIQVSASPAELSDVDRWLVAQQRPTRSASSEKRFTLKTLATRGKILSSIANQLSIKLTVEESLKSTLDERIEIDVNGVSIQDLLRKTLEGSNIDYLIQPGELKLSRRKDRP